MPTKTTPPLKSLVGATLRALPVIILADISGSMIGAGKIAALNEAIKNMLASFAKMNDPRSEIYVSVIAFGGAGAEHKFALQPASQVVWEDLEAGGATPMGAAFAMTAELVEDRGQIPSLAYRPTVVLVTDGQPTDDWERPLAQLQQGRAGKAHRMALGIGGDADESMLKRYLADPDARVFYAEDAKAIKNFFKFVTMSVEERSRSANPNQVPKLQDPYGMKSY